MTIGLGSEVTKVVDGGAEGACWMGRECVGCAYSVGIRMCGKGECEVVWVVCCIVMVRVACV